MTAAYRKIAVVVRGLEGRAENQADHQASAKELLHIHALVGQSLMCINDCLTDVAVAQLLSPLPSQVCLGFHNVSALLRAPKLGPERERPLPAHCVPMA